MHTNFYLPLDLDDRELHPMDVGLQNVGSLLRYQGPTRRGSQRFHELTEEDAMNALVAMEDDVDTDYYTDNEMNDYELFGDNDSDYFFSDEIVPNFDDVSTNNIISVPRIRSNVHYTRNGKRYDCKFCPYSTKYKKGVVAHCQTNHV